VLADLFGRRKIAILSAVLFMLSVGLICIANSFTPLICGRLLQGLSAGMIAVVIPLLVDRKGRTFLLKLGTGGIIIALLLCAFVFNRFESQAIDITPEISKKISATGLTYSVEAKDGIPTRLTVLYDIGEGAKLVSVSSTAKNPVLTLSAPKEGNLSIIRARSGPQPDASTGWAAMACLMLYVAGFAVGPGVCVWLAMSELMPNRIRSTGMGIALLLNQGVATGIAAIFLPTVGAYGYAVMFLAWALATVVYFLTAAFLLPETKGRTLEDIERGFAKPR
jgi:MFS transporter, SP family, solute carrier family 2 (myo-inositol transporter), member 13